MVNTYKLEISGKVQGVWYRDWFCKEARKLKITGYIKNLHNPNIVEAIIQGNLDSVNKLILIAKVGPSLAKVKNLKQNKIKLNVKFDSFLIK